jgi:hypothetical protein
MIQRGDKLIKGGRYRIEAVPVRELTAFGAVLKPIWDEDGDWLYLPYKSNVDKRGATSYEKGI